MEQAPALWMEFPADRPPPEAWPERDFIAMKCSDLVVNIKCQGRWAVFLIGSTQAACLFRPGMLDFKGAAADWLDTLPLDEWECRNGYRRGNRPLADVPGPLLAPLPGGGGGVLVIDYDTCRAWCLNASTPPFRITTATNLDWADDASRPSRIQWLHSLLETGRINQVAFSGAGSPLPLPPCPRGNNPIKWMGKCVADAARQRAPVPPSSRAKAAWSFPSAATFDVPLQDRKWRFLGDPRARLEAFAAIAPQLTPAERLRWEAWAREFRIAGLDRSMRAISLELDLPPAAAGRGQRARM